MNVIARSLASAALAALAASPALGQDFNAMYQNMLAQDRALGAQIQQMQSGIVAQNMQNPRVQQLYQQHLAGGGRLSFQDFAYQYGATGGFTPQGMDAYRRSVTENQRRETAAVAGLRAAERARADAQSAYIGGFHRNNSEFGNMLRGNNTYTSPQTGSQVLSHLQPGQPYTDPATGYVYVMNQRGQYHVRTPQGWAPMTWAR